jgi:uncharacterized protein YqhQ
MFVQAAILPYLIKKGDSVSENREQWIPTNPEYNSNKPMQVGGQAVMEGVMMRSANGVATAVRRANGDIVVQKQNYISVTEKYKWLNVPILRGAVGLIDMMYLGIKTLNFSAEIAMLDVVPDEKEKSKKKEKKKSTDFTLALSLIFALTLGVGIFFIVPLYLTTRVFAIEQTAFAFNLTAGGIRVTILLLYMLGISLMKDVKQLFRYHGAEHKSVFAFELKANLIPESVRNYSRFHPRCGTSFLLIVVFVSVFAFSILDAVLIKLFGSLTLPMRLATHLPFIPIVGGLAYEVIKFSAKHSATWWGRIFITPGLWLQKITTKEPTDAQLEVAIVAIKCALGLEDANKYTLKPDPSSSETIAA